MKVKYIKMSFKTVDLHVYLYIWLLSWIWYFSKLLSEINWCIQKMCECRTLNYKNLRMQSVVGSRYIHRYGFIVDQIDEILDSKNLSERKK